MSRCCKYSLKLDSSNLLCLQKLLIVYQLLHYAIQIQGFTISLTSEFNQPPEFIARAPGRVNLIGEHIDYMGYSVLPFAIEPCCELLFKICQSDKVQVRHISSKYPSATMKVDGSECQIINQYLRYFLAGYLAGIHNCQSPRGLKVLIGGNVPQAAGLSSSSALTVCVSLMASFANDRLSKLQFQSYLQRIIAQQRKAAIAGGGMDQSCSLMGKDGYALYISFDPIRIEEVKLPKGYKFIIANSMTQSKKADTAPFRYNKRVSQCKMAISILTKALKLQPCRTLRQVQQRLKFNFKQAVQSVNKFIPNRRLSISQVEELSFKSATDILIQIPAASLVLSNNQWFHPYNAAIHVFQEAQRVQLFKQVCQSLISDQEKAHKLGILMDQSHKSCNQLYDCSSTQLNQLTAIARKQGALGSRLTGAGWGGCTVSLVREGESSEFIEKVRTQYYAKKNMQGGKQQIFETNPSEGASVFRIAG